MISMKKLLLSFLSIISIIGIGHAEEKVVTLNANNATDIQGTFVAEKAASGSDNGTAAHYQPLESLRLGDFSFAFSTTNSAASSQPAYYDVMSTASATQKTIRVYNGTTMTITAPDGIKITDISFTGSNAGNGLEVNPSDGSFTLSGSNGEWTGSANSISFYTNKTWRINSLEITYSDSSMPVIVPASGTFGKPVEVSLSFEDSESATIYYTLDGTDPTDESTEYSKPFTIQPSINPVTVKAIAIEDDGTASDIATAKYDFALSLPVITPEGGVMSEESVSVTIAPAEGEEANIYYTLDGSTPTTESTVYTAPISISESTVVNAIAYNDPLTSEVASQLYQFGVEPVELTKASFNGATTNTTYGNQSINVSNYGTWTATMAQVNTNATAFPGETAFVLGAKNGEGAMTSGTITGGMGELIFNYTYTVNDDKNKEIKFRVEVFEVEDQEESPLSKSASAEPIATKEFTVAKAERYYNYTAIIPVNTDKDVTIKVTNLMNSGNSQAYRLAVWNFGWTANGVVPMLPPTISPADGTHFTSSETITITAPIDGADIRYTTDGSVPTATSELYQDPFSIYQTTTVRAAIFDGNKMSEIVSATYTLDFAATISPKAGTYYEPVTVTLGATHVNEYVNIYYTLDNSDPETSTTREGYTGPFEVKETTTVKAVAIETIPEEVDENGELKRVSSLLASAKFTIEAPKETFHSFAEIFAYYNAQQANGQKMVYTNNASNVVKIDFITNVAAVSDKYLYLDDTFETGELASMPIVNNSNIDWTTLYAEGDELAAGWVVSFKWEQKVVPTLVLAGQPATLVDVPSGAIIPTDTLTVAQINASAAWNGEDIYYATEHNKIMSGETNPRYVPVPNIALNDPDLAAGLVYVKDVNFSKTTKANTGSNPTRNFTGTSDGESLKFVTRFPIDAYSAGTYNVRGILSYETVVKKEKVDEIGDITQEADTIVSAVVYPLELIAVDPDHGGVVETGNEKFVPAETVTAGDVVIVAPETDSNGEVQSGYAFSPLDVDKTYGFMPYYRTSFAGDTAIVTATQIVTLTVSDYTDGNAEYYYMQDSYGRYIYQKDDFNSFNITYDLPTEEAQLKAYSWNFAIDENTGDVVITNVEKGKWIQYSTKYNSFGCYPSTQDQSIMPKLYVKADDDNTSAIEKVEVEVDGPAEIFNIQGIRMPQGANLPAGIYIVRQGSKVNKIIVR